jgi:DMSO/TMAO reductase YedYZ molybdopterin-dependent catalytic subunit
VVEQDTHAEALRLLEPAPLVMVRETPFNAESPLAQQVGAITAVERFYVRSHFEDVAITPADEWRLELGGAVARPTSFVLAELLEMAARPLVATLECAGNGRLFLQPRVDGEQWAYGAVSNAEWAGVPLATLLEQAGVADDAVEVLFVGADRGKSPRDGSTIAFERSLPLAEARRPDVLLAFAMNGAPLSFDHGAPLRLIVPDWYGVASVKWLREIRVLREPFQGAYQTFKYVFDRGDGSPVVPLGRMRVRAVIAGPAAGARLAPRETIVRGYAWSGEGAVGAVELSTDGGASWAAAELDDASGRHGWRPWRFRWQSTPGHHTLIARARDAAGNQQPLEQVWNVHGYCNNAVQRVEVDVAG